MGKSSVSFADMSSRVGTEIASSATKIAEGMARETETQTKRNIGRGTNSGLRYPVPGTSRTYQASSPGEAPANRTGDLMNSYTTTQISQFAYAVFSNLRYAKIEMGFGDVAPRPALRPANQEVLSRRDDIISRATKNLKR